MKSVTSENFEKIIKSEKYSVIIFWGEYCLQCIPLKETMRKLEDKYSNIKFYSANIGEIGDIAISYGIMSLPTTIIFKDSKSIHQFYGNLGKDLFEKEFDKL